MFIVRRLRRFTQIVFREKSGNQILILRFLRLYQRSISNLFSTPSKVHPAQKQLSDMVLQFNALFQ
jgi:hypothetical protein